MKKFISIFISIMLIFCFSSSSFALDKTKEAQKLYKQSLKVQEYNPKEAIKLLTKAIAYNPKNPEYYFQRGFIEPDYSKVLLDYERAVVLNPDKYYSKCFGTVVEDNVIITNFNSMIFDTNWKRESNVSSSLTDIKNYLSTYKGDKLKNAQSIIDNATDYSIIMFEAQPDDKSALASVAIVPDYKNEFPDPDTYIYMMSQSISADNNFTNVSDIQTTEIGDMDFAYIDYTLLQKDAPSLISRHYAVAFDYHVITITVFAQDKNAFDSAIKDFVNTVTLY